MKTPTLVNITFWSGLLSIFAWPLSIIPVTAVVLGFYTLLRFTQETDQTGKAETILGFTLGIIFILVRLAH